MELGEGVPGSVDEDSFRHHALPLAAALGSEQWAAHAAAGLEGAGAAAAAAGAAVAAGAAGAVVVAAGVSVLVVLLLSVGAVVDSAAVAVDDDA